MSHHYKYCHFINGDDTISGIINYFQSFNEWEGVK